MAPSIKKRKRDETPAEGLSFQLASSSGAPGAIGPLLVSFPSLEAPTSTPFQCYARKRSKTTKSKEKDAEEDDRMILVGETPSVEFVTNEGDTKRVASSGCRYLLAVHNPRTSSLTLLPSSSTPHVLTRTVKALKSIPPAPAPSATAYFEARTALGETFGTKKAKAIIRARERNRVDVGAMEGVMSYVMEGIEKGAVNLPSKDEAKDVADANRLIPPFSATATESANIYPLHDIIPEAELKAISVSAFDEAQSHKERMALLPFSYSKWLQAHIKPTNTSTKARKLELKIVYYISAMFAFRRLVDRRIVEKDQFHEKMAGVPSIIVDSLLARFTEVSRGSTTHQSTTATQTKLLTHILALCLKLDGFASDPVLLATDLSMATTKINSLYQSLGCKMKKLSETQRSKLGLSDSYADKKMAVLSAPVSFPKTRLRKKK